MALRFVIPRAVSPTSWLRSSRYLALRTPAHEKVLVGLPVLGAHHYVDYGVDTSCQVYQDIAGNIEASQVDPLPVCLA